MGRTSEMGMIYLIHNGCMTLPKTSMFILFRNNENDHGQNATAEWSDGPATRSREIHHATNCGTQISRSTGTHFRLTVNLENQGKGHRIRSYISLFILNVLNAMT